MSQPRLRSQPLPFLCPPADSGPAAGRGLRVGTLLPPPLSFARPTCLSPGRRSWSPREALCGGCGRHLHKSATRRDGRSGPQRVARPPERTPALCQGWSAGSLQTDAPPRSQALSLNTVPPPPRPVCARLPAGPQPPPRGGPGSTRHPELQAGCGIGGALASSLHASQNPVQAPGCRSRPWSTPQNLHLQSHLLPDSPRV